MGSGVINKYRGLFLMIFELIYGSIATGVISCVVTKAKIGKPIRDYCEGKFFFGNLSKCPFCVSLWTGWFVSVCIPPVDICPFWLIDWFLQGLVVAGLSTITIRFLMSTYKWEI